MKKVILPAVLTLALGTSASFNYVQYNAGEKLSAELDKKENEIVEEKKTNEEITKANNKLYKTHQELKKSHEQLSEEKLDLEENLELQKANNEKLKSELEKKRLTEAKAKAKRENAARVSTQTAQAMPSRGVSSEVKRTMYMTATAYTAYCNGCSGITKTGINLRKNPNAKVIAVDPNVIPLGSKVYVEGYGYAVAGDTGGAIKGNIVDLHMPTKAAAYSFGRQHNVKVQVLN